MIVFYPCKKCNVSRHNIYLGRKIESFRSSVTNRVYSIKWFLTCAIKNIVYLLTCPCGKQYVEQTTQTFAVRVNEHICNIKKGLTNHGVPKHYLRCHNTDPTGTQFLLIDHFMASWRGVSRLQTFWIYELKSYGLKVEWDINCFIDCA